MTTTVASFDLGIKNLSYCVSTFDASGQLMSIDRWANLNLLADGADSQSQTRCHQCSGPASWQDMSVSKILCKKCAKKYPKLLLELTKPTLADWRTWVVAHTDTDEKKAKKLTKVAIEETASAIRLMPYKAPKVKGVSLQQILVGMEKCLDTELQWLAKASRIRLENQPSEFAPHMKSIQVMLFVLIDHRLRKEYGWNGTMEFVNASVKTRGTAAGTGKEAKRSRKLAGIARVSDILTHAGKVDQLTWWKSQAKQDDLADAFLMCVDAV
jgi:hypothetical protein